ncbi:uncharacterized protein LOC126416757 [Schistocerca serialis cubense]|uniref:uncharacterized protein LOC126416757 n=1 Tax=Schistocerca serialis cubense TaxID=2023355 RepID=UPI00214ED0C9|nr:uncharacterized protein LOC126416757 [Schistocerca serialis cubense]
MKMTDGGGYRASPAVLAQIVVHVSEWLPDIDDRCALLQSMGRDLAGSDVATAVCQIRRAELLLQQENQKGEEQQGAAAVDAALPLLVEVEERLVETAEVVPQEVSASCYRLLAQCYSTKKDLTRYQDAALKQRLRPVLWALEESPSRGWLPALLEATDDGDVEAVRAAGPLLQREPRLEHRQQLLEEKAATRALQAVCRSQRHLSMERAAAATHLSEDEAEQLVLRALARGAIDGHVDRSTLIVERVRPSPVGVLQLLPDIKKLDKWIENISEQDTRFAGQMESIISL